MKRLFGSVVAFLMVFLLLLFAGPFLVSDNYPTTVTQPTEFEVYMDGSTTPIISPAQTVSGGVRLHYDVGAVATGNHNVTIKAVRVDVAWGRLTSVSSAPFAFTKPSTPGVATNIGLEP